MAKFIKIQGMGGEIMYINPDYVQAISPTTEDMQKEVDGRKGILGKLDSEKIGCVISMANDDLIMARDSMDSIASRFGQ